MQGISKKSMLLRFFSVLLILCILLSSSASLTVSGEETDPEGKTSDPVYEQETAAEEITSDKTPYEEPALALYPEAIEGKAEVAGLERLAFKEDNNTLVYSNGDGTETMFIFGCDIKYVDSDGEIKDKSTRLIADKNGFANVDNDIRVSFSSDASDGAKLSYDGIEIVLIPISASEETGKAALSIEIDGLGEERERVVYASVFADAKLVYTPTFEGFKEDIVVSRYNGVTEYSFRLLTGGATLKDGTLYYEGKETARLGDITVFDSGGQVDLGTIKSETVREGYEYLVTVCVDDAFMKAAVYPVYIDPSISITTSGSGSNKTIQDAPVYSNNNNANGGNEYNLCGFCGASIGYGRVLYKLPGLTEREDYQSIAATQINSVTLHLREGSGKSGTATVKSYPFKESWNEASVNRNNVNVSNYDSTSSYVSTQTFSGSPYWWVFDITQTVKAWKNGSFGSGAYGILLKNTNETNSDLYRNFLGTEYSSTSYRPYITFTYTPTITLSSSRYDLDVGNSGIAIITTTYPSSETVEWSITPPTGVISLSGGTNKTKYIAAEGAGTATITVTCGTISQNCYVYVKQNIGTYYITPENYCFYLSNNSNNITAENYSTSSLRKWNLCYLGNNKYALQSAYNNTYLTAQYLGKLIYIKNLSCDCFECPL